MGASPTRGFTPPTTVADCLLPALERDPAREAVVTRSGRWTFEEFDAACAQGAGAWRELGVSAGDRVAASLPNDIDILIAFHAAMRIGAIWVGVNQALAPPEKSYLLADSGSSIIVCDDATAATLAPLRDQLPALRSVVTADDWRAQVRAATPAAGLAPVEPDAPAALGYTSGTTGRPKAAVHSQRNLLLPGAVLCATRGYGSMLRKGDCLPLTIVNMMALTTLLTARAAGTAVIMDQMYAKGVAQWIEREAVSVWNGPPALLHSMITDPDIGRPALRSLEECWSGGSALPETLRHQFAERFGVPVIATYGLTEAPTIVSIDPPDGEFVPGASGQVLPHLRLTIADSGADKSGEICLSAADAGPYAGLYHPPLGYWQRPQASRELCAGAMVHTGDIGFVSDGSWLHVLDRRNLVIVRGGANVYPAEVERVINDIPGVAASAVIGFPDERLGERVAAAVVLDRAELTVEQIAERCLTELAKYKVPERLVVVEALPRNAMGKVDRTAVRSLLSGC